MSIEINQSKVLAKGKSLLVQWALCALYLKNCEKTEKLDEMQLQKHKEYEWRQFKYIMTKSRMKPVLFVALEL